jgi:hypothetical protein
MAIVRNLLNGQYYRYHGNDVYENIITGVRGKISPIAARKNLRISIEETAIFNEYPLVEELVKKLKLVCYTKEKTQ